MPILHQQFVGESLDPDGNKQPINPRLFLFQRGPVIQVSLSLAESVSSQILERGEVLPTPRSGLALIDTGAALTCVDDSLAQEIGLPVIDTGVITSATHENIPVNIYPVLIEIVGPNLRLNVERTAGVALAPQGLVALIGRDALSLCTLFYNGFVGEITLSL